MIDIQDLEKKEIKTALKKLMLETFLEITEETTPPDKSTLFLYQLIGDFREFRAAVERRLGTLESDVTVLKSDVMVLKADVAELKTDFREFKAAAERKLAIIEGRLDEMVTKSEFKAGLKELVVSIGVSMRNIIKEELAHKQEP
jgi:hypothetical protein